MKFLEKLREVQAALNQQQIEGWLLYDFRGCNNLALNFLEIPSGKMITRRFFYWIPQKGDPIKIVPIIEPYTLDHLPGIKWIYRGWEEMERNLFALAIEHRRIAMEYSPFNALPVVSKVDAGTIELLRKAGAEIVSSANLLQRYTSVWTDDQLHSHLYAAELLNEIVDQTWAFIETSLKKNRAINEYEVQQFMLQRMHAKGCTTDKPPICAINAHSADPHYQPQKRGSLPISSQDFILLDLWCKKAEPHSVYADITRVGVAAAHPTAKQLEIFHHVKQARDQATEFIKSRYEQTLPIQAWEVDQICRNAIVEAGYGDYFVHRTGHNIGEELHGPGANLDNFETHDFRFLLPGTCFSVEPGIYLPNEFGVRLEYDIYLDPSGEIKITGGIQKQLVCLGINNCK